MLRLWQIFPVSFISWRGSLGDFFLSSGKFAYCAATVSLPPFEGDVNTNKETCLFLAKGFPRIKIGSCETLSLRGHAQLCGMRPTPAAEFVFWDPIFVAGFLSFGRRASYSSRGISFLRLGIKEVIFRP